MDRDRNGMPSTGPDLEILIPGTPSREPGMMMEFRNLLAEYWFYPSRHGMTGRRWVVDRMNPTTSPLSALPVRMTVAPRTIKAANSRTFG